ncbi:MAG: cytochrome c-type biogenesis protein CcmH [Anaerolineales bacterium]|jgi:cytochrome c-type biogenesis protein CcmH|nr:cytochrome c-type biogenesis protein CcmH [Anaerolineales bacterium]
MKKLVLLFIFALLASFAIHGAAAAQSPNPTPSDNEVNQIARDLYCPVCENTPLDVCPTQACAQWRELIRLKLSEGWTEAQIKQYFVDQYGARVLSSPPTEGFSILIYIIPPIFLAIGVLIVFRTLRSMRKPPAPAAAQIDSAEQPALADDYLRRVEEELKQRS